MEVETSNLESFTSSINTTIKTRLNAETIVSGSSQVIGILSSLNTYTGSNDTTNTAQNSRLTSIESVTGSYETKGRGIVSGSSQITFSGISSLPTLVSGSSQITLSSTTGYGSVLNQAVLSTSSPTFAGGTFNGNIQLGSNTNQFIRFRTLSAWDYYLKGDSDDFVIYDSQNTEFFRAIYNGGGTGKYAQFLNSLRAHNNSNVTVLGTLTENSSIRYKENVETLTNSLDKVIQLRGVTYTKKDTGLTELGLIAEEVNEILPEVVLKNEEGEPDSVSYGRITALLIEAIKDLKKEIEELKANR